jgi:hypothetical protein
MGAERSVMDCVAATECVGHTPRQEWVFHFNRQDVSPIGADFADDRGWRADPWPLFISHFVQLSLHDGPLPLGYASADDAGEYDRGSQPDHPSIAFRYPIDKRLLAYGGLLLGYLATVERIYAASSRRHLIAAALFGLAILFACHSVGLMA